MSTPRPSTRRPALLDAHKSVIVSELMVLTRTPLGTDLFESRLRAAEQLLALIRAAHQSHRPAQEKP